MTLNELLKLVDMTARPAISTHFRMNSRTWAYLKDHPALVGDESLFKPVFDAFLGLGVELHEDLQEAQIGRYFKGEWQTLSTFALLGW